uniref:Uncharacterized protein n=1 Tax=Haemonchus contortus TaxID=6289 RepID=A0A7I4Z375_HAECO
MQKAYKWGPDLESGFRLCGSSSLTLARIATVRVSPSRKASFIRPPRTTDPSNIGRAADPSVKERAAWHIVGIGLVYT